MTLVSGKPKKAGRIRSILRIVFNRFTGLFVLSVVLMGGVGYGLLELRNVVHAQPEYSQKLARVSLDGRPTFLPSDIPDNVMAQLQKAANGRSVFDPALAHDLYDLAKANPWVKDVTAVSKNVDGSVLVRAEFRRPLALARSDKASQSLLVDEEGYVLPMPAQRIQPGAFITIFGVDTAPPAPGQKWDVSDLADGIKLLKLIKDKPYATEITGIDVRNYGGRVNNFESHLRINAQLAQGNATQVLFGRFPADDGIDYCLTPDEMLANLDAVVATQGGRLSGQHRMIDVRYDKPHVSLH